MKEIVQRYIKACKKLRQPPSKFIRRVLVATGESFTDELILNGSEAERAYGSSARLTKRDATAICLLLENDTSFHVLRLRCNNISNEGTKWLAKLLRKTMTLREIDITFNGIGPSGLETLIEGLLINETLSCIRMDDNKIGNLGGVLFAQVLQVRPNIQALHLSNTDMGIEGESSKGIPHAQENCLNRPLPVFWLTRGNSPIHMGRLLQVNKGLTEIHLQKCAIADFGVTRLVDALVHNTTLRYLDLGCNRIGRDGAKELARLLGRNTVLQVLDLCFNRIEDDGAITLSHVLPNNTSLQALAIRSNCIAGSGLCALANALYRNDALQQLYIWGNRFDQSACVAIRDVLNAKRLQQGNTDVKPYVVDSMTHLAQLNHDVIYSGHEQ
ncbi:PREDICTED: leucine-rich repeat-containing protein 34-like [Priapulus caudatus]|uniref:Leucine-rich repeat-containing protein 34-like n=1 Tax=Priapulus caudatus TaxID=37621 RepID=A0ABM1DS76_PRICU|nr:PREDICTED: leucine-rich repeat-containing protein 34-like [Priapulus caudatus]